MVCTSLLDIKQIPMLVRYELMNTMVYISVTDEKPTIWLYKGQVLVRLFFGPQHFSKKIIWLESALNYAQNYVFFFEKIKEQKSFAEKILAVVSLREQKKVFFLSSIWSRCRLSTTLITNINFILYKKWYKQKSGLSWQKMFRIVLILCI